MSYNPSDLKHLELMSELEKKQAPVSEKTEMEPILKLEETKSFNTNILKLCNSLRANGFTSYAESLENKFLQYRQAETAYLSSKENDGEKWVEHCHPEGDTRLADAADELGDFETIVSRQKKILKVVNKQPTGKLASYVEQCKIALGIGEGTAVTQVASPLSATKGLVGINDAAKLNPIPSSGPVASNVAKPATTSALSRLFPALSKVLTTEVGLTGGGIAAGAGAVAGGLLITAFAKSIADEQFRKLYETTDLQESYRSFMGEVKDEERAVVDGTKHAPEKLAASFQKVLTAAATIEDFINSENKDPEALAAMLDYIKELNLCNKYVMDIWSFAQNKIEDSYLPKIIKVQGGWGDIAVSGANFAKNLQYKSDMVVQHRQKINNALAAMKPTGSTNEAATKLQSSYESSLNDIKNLKQIVDALKKPNFEKKIDWLDNAETLITSQRNKFKSLSDIAKSDPEVLEKYMSEFKDINDKLTGFKSIARK